jgi:hypothetical protein
MSIGDNPHLTEAKFQSDPATGSDNKATSDKTASTLNQGLDAAALACAPTFQQTKSKPPNLVENMRAFARKFDGGIIPHASIRFEKIADAGFESGATIIVIGKTKDGKEVEIDRAKSRPGENISSSALRRAFEKEGIIEKTPRLSDSLGALIGSGLLSAQKGLSNAGSAISHFFTKTLTSSITGLFKQAQNQEVGDSIPSVTKNPTTKSETQQISSAQAKTVAPSRPVDKTPTLEEMLQHIAPSAEKDALIAWNEVAKAIKVKIPLPEGGIKTDADVKEMVKGLSSWFSANKDAIQNISALSLESVAHIPKEFEQLTGLKDLRLYNFKGTTLPSEIYKLSKLERLNLYSDNIQSFNQTDLEKLPLKNIILPTKAMYDQLSDGFKEKLGPNAVWSPMTGTESQKWQSDWQAKGKWQGLKAG